MALGLSDILGRFLPILLALALFIGLDVEGYVDHDGLVEALSSAGVIGTILVWLIGGKRA